VAQDYAKAREWFKKAALAITVPRPARRRDLMNDRQRR